MAKAKINTTTEGKQGCRNDSLLNLNLASSFLSLSTSLELLISFHKENSTWTPFQWWKETRTILKESPESLISIAFASFLTSFSCSPPSQTHQKRRLKDQRSTPTVLSSCSRVRNPSSFRWQAVEAEEAPQSRGTPKKRVCHLRNSPVTSTVGLVGFVEASSSYARLLQGFLLEDSFLLDANHFYSKWNGMPAGTRTK